MKPLQSSKLKTAPVPLSEFGFDSKEDEDKKITGIVERVLHPSLLFYPVDKKHVIDRGLFREFTAFLLTPFGCVYTLIGPQGCGKSSGIRQITARLNWPIIEVTGSGSLEFRELVGGLELVIEDGVAITRWKDGPLLLAMRHGAVFIINEYDYVRPTELAALNDIIETGSLYVVTTNEVVQAADTFRIVFTGNTNGYGDPTGAFVETLRQNGALLDRRIITLLDYLTPAEEEKILLDASGGQLSALIPSMIEVGNSIRKQYKNGEMTATISCRKLVHWVVKSITFSKAPNPLQYALQHVLLNGIPAEDSEIIDQAANNVLGESYRPQIDPSTTV